jgi:hypothetical protein
MVKWVCILAIFVEILCAEFAGNNRKLLMVVFGLFSSLSIQLPFIGMYRREECLDLLGEPDINDMDDKPKIRYHEVCSVCCSTFCCLN